MSEQLVAEPATYTTHQKKKDISMHSAGFEPATRTFQQPQTDALDRTATGMLLNRIFGHELHRNFFVGGGGVLSRDAIPMHAFCNVHSGRLISET